MAARLILESEIIDVTNPPVLLYGQPGAGKSSMAFTAPKPLCLDFDGGAHRSSFRKTTMRFDGWEDVIAEQKAGRFSDYETIILDTVGTLLDSMIPAIIAGNAKMGNKLGGLSIQGWGALKGLFSQWLGGLKQQGKQVIMLAHQKEEKDGDTKSLRPDISGGSYGIVMNSADIVGYVSYRNNNRSVSWEPTDSFFAKNGAKLKSGAIPDFHSEPDFMAKLLVEAKKNLGHTASASAAVAQAVGEWEASLRSLNGLNALNGLLPRLKEVKVEAVRIQAWKLVQGKAAALGLTFDKTAKVFVEPVEREPGVEEEEGKGAA